MRTRRIGKIRYQARHNAFLFGRNFKLVAGRTEQPIQRTMRFEKRYAAVDARPGPVIRSVKIAEIHSVVKIEAVDVFFGERVVDENVVVGGNKNDITEFVFLVEGCDKPSVERRPVFEL